MYDKEIELEPDDEAREAGYPDFRRAKADFRVWPGIIVQAYLYSCTVCGKTVYTSTQYTGEPLKPSLPTGWKSLQTRHGESYYCQKHEVKILTLIDGKEINTK